MRILFTCPTFFPHPGGAESCLDALTRTLVLRGHTVAVVTARLSPTLPTREVRCGVDIHRRAYPPRRLRLHTGLSILTRSVGLFLTLGRVVTRGRMEVVCIGLVGIEAFLVLLLRRVAPFRLVVYLHGGELRSYVRVSPFMRRALRACLLVSDAVIAVSEALRDEAIAFEPRVRRKVQVIANGIDVSAFAAAAPYAHPRPYALYVGRLHPVKDVDTLIGAFRQVAVEVPDLDLVLAGTGPEEAHLRALVTEGDLGPRITFLGAQDRSQVAALLRGCEFVVLPSVSEGCPVVVLEAMAAGRMTIGSRVTGIVEVVQPAGAGVLFEPGNEGHLAEMMRMYHQDAHARADLEANARRRAPTYEIRDLAARHLGVYGGDGRRFAIATISLFNDRDRSCAGLASYYFNLAESLAELGHDVHTITTADPAGAPASGRVLTVPVAGEPLWDQTGRPRFLPGLRRVAGRLRFAWKAYRAALRLERSEGLDVVIAPELFGQGLFVALFMRRKLITRIHTPTWIADRYNARPRPLFSKALTVPERMQARRSRAVSVASAQLATVVERAWRIPPARVHRIPNGVRIDWVRSLAERHAGAVPGNYLLYFGRLERRKGVHVLSAALHDVFARQPDVAMVFIGSDGGLWDAIARDHRHHADRVRLVGAMDTAPLFAAIQGARLVVLPSLFENMSNAGLEAMALARPVLGTYGTAFEEIIQDGVNGFLTRPGDAAALADTILSSLARPDLDEIGRRGFETVRGFDACVIAPRYVELCQQIASDA